LTGAFEKRGEKYGVGGDRGRKRGIGAYRLTRGCWVTCPNIGRNAARFAAGVSHPARYPKTWYRKGKRRCGRKRRRGRGWWHSSRGTNM